MTNDLGTRTAERKATPAQIFHYEKPEFDPPAATRRLGTTDIAFMNIQIIKDGGESTLHFHTISDGFWMVLSGRPRFYTTDDQLVADLGPMEGIVVPRGYPYWFESSGETPVELLQFEAMTQPMYSKEDIRERRASISSPVPMSGVGQTSPIFRDPSAKQPLRIPAVPA